MAELVQMKVKIALLGEGTVGKTSLLRRFVYDEFDDKYLKTFGTKTTKKVVTLTDPVDQASVELTLLVTDIMGQTELAGLHDRYLYGTKGAFVVCDITNRISMENMVEWAKRIRGVAGENIPIVFVANKFDLLDKAMFDLEIILDLADEFNAPCYFTSAKTGENVEQMFQTMAMKILPQRHQG
jgi:small GTP-binding protein